MSAGPLHTPLIQVVNGDGVFQTDSLQTFSADNKLAESRKNYQVIAIMGPQSSGKSTLLNHVFGTGFQMMDAMTGRSQTTKGIWMSKSPKITEISTLVMDLEGSDGRERGEDDTNFERQSALFALAIADVLMVNIWCHDIGREHGSGKPLLKTIFQVNLKLFAPEPNRRRTVLLFVIRDKSKTPLPKLIEVMEADLGKMWASIAKPPQYEHSHMHDFFEVQYAGLSHFEEKYEDFMADTVMLRRRFTADSEESLVRVPDDKLPGEVFCLSIGNIWDVIRSQKDLNLPAHKIMVANIRCREIADEQLRRFSSDQAWESLRDEAKAGLVPGFGSRAHMLLDSCIHGYIEEALYFDTGVREEKQGELAAKLHALVWPLYVAQARQLHDATLAGFERDMKAALVDRPTQFAECSASCRAASLEQYTKAYSRDVMVPGSGWDGSDEAAALTAAVDACVSSAKAERVADALQRAERSMATLISGPVIGLLDACPTNLWPKLHGVAREAAGAAEQKLLGALSGYALSAAEEAKLRASVAASARTRLENHVREAALTRISRMKDRFHEAFTLDENKTPRMWKATDDIPLIARGARMAAANVLAQLAIIRPEDASSVSWGRVVEQAVMRLAQPDASAAPAGSASAAFSFGRSSSFGLSSSPAAAADAAEEALAGGAAGSGGGSGAEEALDVQTAGSWPGVDPNAVLLEPHEVRTSWREFLSSSNIAVQQALSTQQANKLAGNRPLPYWALAAILLLGWNEFTSLLWNPFWLVLGIAVVLFLRTLYFELDVDSEMQRGALPGAIALASKFMPAVQAVLRRTFASGVALASRPQELANVISHTNYYHHLGLDHQQQQQPGQDAASSEAAANTPVGPGRDSGRAGDALFNNGGTLTRRRGAASSGEVGVSREAAATIKSHHQDL